MLKFEKDLIFTGQETKERKDKTTYTLVSYLGETGQTFQTMAKCAIPNDLKQLDKVHVNFNLIPGRYFTFETIAIRKI